MADTKASDFNVKTAAQTAVGDLFPFIDISAVGAAKNSVIARSEIPEALSLVIGTNVQAYDATLAAVAAGTYTGSSSITTLGTISSITVTGGSVTGLTTFALRDTSAAYDLTFVATSSTPLSAGRNLTFDVVNASRSVKLAGNVDLAANFTTSGANALTLTTTGSTNVTLPTSGTLAILGANTFTALQTITQGSANSGIIASTGYSLTGSNATNMIDLAGTWNTTGVPTAIKLNITNTASDITSKLIDLQLNGNTILGVDRQGTIYLNGNNYFYGYGSSPLFRLTSGNVIVPYNLYFSSGLSISGAQTSLICPSSNVLELINGTSSQSFRVYNTYTSSTNKEYLEFNFASNIAQLFTVAGSAGGTTRALKVGAGSSVGSNLAGAATYIVGGRSTGSGAGGSIIFQTTPAGSSGSSANALTNRWEILYGGNLIPSTSYTYDIGNSSYVVSSIYTQNLVNSVGTPLLLPIGGMMDYYGLNLPTNFILADGSSVSLSTYSSLASELRASQPGTASGTTITLSDTSMLMTGWTVVGDAIPDGTTIVSIDSSTQITISQSSAGSTNTYYFYPYGAVDANNFTLPNVSNSSKLAYKIIRTA